MNFSILLIILSSVQLILCLQSNATVDDTCNLCTLSWLRRKRAQTEYTRWRANQETTQEFIVKVLDEDLTTDRTQKIVAVNIQPLPKNEKKIIIGGALVPRMTTVTTLSGPLDYTRFMPPTTIPASHDKGNVRSILDESIIMSPRGLLNSENKLATKKNINRDESPPSGPRFLGRTQASIARQYAPVAPVSFKGGTTVTPLTPRSVERFIYKTPNDFPTGTSSMPNIIKPSRTTSKSTLNNIFLFGRNINNEILGSRTSIKEILEPHRTLSTCEQRKGQESFIISTEDNLINWRRIDSPTEGQESDLSYNMIFLSDHDRDKDQKDDTEESKIKNDKYEAHYDLDWEMQKPLNKSLGDDDDSDNSIESTICEGDTDIFENSTAKHTNVNKPVLDHNLNMEEKKTTYIKRNKNCTMTKLRQLNFNSPLTLPEIVTQLKQWAETSPVAKWVDITNGNYTTMENPIYMMIVDDPSSGQIISAKKTVLLIAGIQGRDHHAVAAAMYVLYQLIERSEAHADLLTKYRFWVIPVFNPDGYDYSMTFPHKREWTKNLRQKWESCKGRDSCDACNYFGLRCTIQSCYGVNLDRNFEYQWIPTEELRSEHPCGALYAGERQLSEAETRALTHFLQGRPALLFTFIAFKEGDVLVNIPLNLEYCIHIRIQERDVPLIAFIGNVLHEQRLLRIALVGDRMWLDRLQNFYVYVAALYAGGVEDWVDGHLGIDNTYTVMMFRPTDSYNSKLITERVVHEAYAALDTLLLQSAEPFALPTVTLATAAAPSSQLFSKIFIVLIIYFVSILK